MRKKNKLERTAAMGTIQDFRIWQMEGYISSWKSEHDPETACGILSSLGAVTRMNLSKAQKRHLYLARGEISKDIPALLEEFEKYMSQTTLLETTDIMLKEWRENNDIIYTFYAQRDDAQLARGQAQDLLAIHEELWKRYDWLLTRKPGGILYEVDMKVLLHKDLVDELRKIGAVEPVSKIFLDESFWWIPQQKLPCHIPMCYRVKIMTDYVLAEISPENQKDFETHMLQCPVCFTVMERSKDMILDAIKKERQ